MERKELKESKKNNQLKAIEEARKNKEIISKKYNIPISSIVWMGKNKFIICNNEKETRITLQ